MATKKSKATTLGNTSPIKSTTDSTGTTKESQILAAKKAEEKDPYKKLENDNWVFGIGNSDKFKMHSQSGEEGYIGYILHFISANKFIVDLGAWDGSHLSNSKYFIDHQGYKSLLIDGDNHGNENVKQHFITKDNIVELLSRYGCPKYFDLLNIDLDGNDIYILDSVLNKYKPALICAEFNPIWEPGVTKVIAYNPHHTWNNDDYYGFSFEAGKQLASKHGYKVVFSNDNLNMYFVRAELFNDTNIEIPVTYQKTNYHPHNSTGEWITF